MDHPELNVPRLYPLFCALAVALNCCVFCSGMLAAQSPFKGTPWPVPGTIEAENFDEGGEGISYHDTGFVPRLVEKQLAERFIRRLSS